MNKWLEYAVKQATTHDYDKRMTYRLCAILVRGGNVLSVGYNNSSTNGFVEHYTDRVRGTGIGYSLSTHAEMDAVLQTRRKTDLRGSKIYVCRIRRDGSCAIGRPCEICQEMLKSYGIRRAYYSIEDNEFGVLKL